MDITANPGFLLHKVGSMIERVSDSILFDSFGMGYSQFKVLMALTFHEDIQQKQIASFLGQTEASISRQIKLLKDAGYISVRQGDDDRKKHHVSTTNKGRKFIQEALEALNNFYGPILSSLTPHAQTELTKSLSHLHDQLTAYIK